MLSVYSSAMLDSGKLLCGGALSLCQKEYTEKHQIVSKNKISSGELVLAFLDDKPTEVAV